MHNKRREAFDKKDLAFAPRNAVEFKLKTSIVTKIKISWKEKKVKKLKKNLSSTDLTKLTNSNLVLLSISEVHKKSRWKGRVQFTNRLPQFGCIWCVTEFTIHYRCFQIKVVTLNNWPQLDNKLAKLLVEQVVNKISLLYAPQDKLSKLLQNPHNQTHRHRKAKPKNYWKSLFRKKLIQVCKS